MTKQVSESPFGEPDYVYKPPEKKGGVGKYVLIGLGIFLLLGLGTCVWGFGDLFRIAAERQPATVELVEEILAEGLADADSELWADEAGVTAEDLADVQNLLDYFNTVESIGEATCNAQSIARTNGPSGTFVSCWVPITYDVTTGRVDITWKKESEDWTVYRFNTSYVDASGYYEAQARAQIEAEAAAAEPD